MSNAFGFSKPGSKGTPDSRKVGEALMMQRQQQAQQGPEMGPSTGVPTMADPAMETDPAAMRQMGANLMGGPGQTELGLGDGEQGPSSINTAVGEALTRMGGGYGTNPNPNKPRQESLRMLQHLGLSEAEAHLMLMSGGA